MGEVDAVARQVAEKEGGGGIAGIGVLVVPDQCAVPQAHKVLGDDSGISDESTLGEITKMVLVDNRSRWSGNHLMAPEVVPGILLVNRKLKGEGHDLTDLTATLLEHYGIQVLPDMTGEPIL